MTGCLDVRNSIELMDFLNNSDGRTDVGRSRDAIASKNLHSNQLKKVCKRLNLVQNQPHLNHFPKVSKKLPSASAAKEVWVSSMFGFEGMTVTSSNSASMSFGIVSHLNNLLIRFNPPAEVGVSSLYRAMHHSRVCCAPCQGACAWGDEKVDQ